jgi:hypothetical protein
VGNALVGCAGEREEVGVGLFDFERVTVDGRRLADHTIVQRNAELRRTALCRVPPGGWRTGDRRSEPCMNQSNQKKCSATLATLIPGLPQSSERSRFWTALRAPVSNSMTQSSLQSTQHNTEQ